MQNNNKTHKRMNAQMFTNQIGKEKYTFTRTKDSFNRPIITVTVDDGQEEYYLSTIRIEEVQKKRLNWDVNADIIKFQKEYR